MNKELEALDELERFVNEDIGIKGHNESGWHLADKKEFHLIKSALERLEKLEKFVKILKDYGLDYCSQTMLWYKTYKDYKKIKTKNHNMTETEFNDLKEMLEEK